MEQRDTAPAGPADSYARMLLRQHPWLQEILAEGEVPIALSYRRPERLFGASLLFIGCFSAAEALLHPGAFGGALPGVMLFLAGAALACAGVWAIWFARRSCLVVTSERVLYQRVGLFGRPRKPLIIPRSEIRRARFFKSTVMYRVRRSDGGIAITTKSGGTVFIASLRDAENILGALQ